MPDPTSTTPSAPAAPAARRPWLAPWSACASSPVLAFWLPYIPPVAGVGFLSGFAVGSRARGKRFLAENAHRLPTTQGGWYVYHQEKKSAMIRSGARSGVRMGLRFGAALGGWIAALQLVAQVSHGGGHWGEAGAAGTLTGLGWALLQRLPWRLARRAVGYGGAFGLTTGLLLDTASYVHGISVKDGVTPVDAIWCPIDVAAWAPSLSAWLLPAAVTPSTNHGPGDVDHVPRSPR